MHFDVLLARVAFDAAAPVESAPAALGGPHLGRLETAPAAHEFAAVHSGRRPVARPAASSWRSGCRIGVAEVARLVDVDEVLAGRPVESPVALNEPCALPVERHLRGAVVSVAQTVGGLAERRQLIPAGTEAARS